MMHLGLVDFIAFGSVCKSWRSFAVRNWNKFMVSKQPMHLSISSRLNEKECYLEDYQRRKLKTTIPHSNGRICVGITCGYLIFFGREACDFWLVNPVTRKELHFLDFPFGVTPFPKRFRGILVYSPSMSGWVFVVITVLDNKIAFSLPGERSRWYHVTSPCDVHDLHFFKGKIYTMDWFNNLCELRLHPVPTLAPLEVKKFPWKHNYALDFVSSHENLYVVDAFGDEFLAFEVDFGEMKWVKSDRAIGEYAVFLSTFKCCAAIRPDTWVHPWARYERLNFSDGYYESRIRVKCLNTNMWYFPHNCLIDTDSAGKKTDALLNIMED
ncbi:uncharacterized protein LOC143630884 [Bidens hawaiensis]|uniref:uncharacterized protein LOC143630884 n=1 Tax=Bidens hawaiensis TaxID=980011 RepID=UPI004049B060